MQLDSILSKIYLEGGGGGGFTESYELAAYFYSNKVNLVADIPFMFITGDEQFYETVKSQHL